MSISYLLAFAFMLISSKGNFTSYFDIFFYIMDIIMLYYGFNRRIFKLSDLKMFFNFALIYLGFMVFRFYILNQLAFHFLLSDINFMVQRCIFAFLFCAVMRENTLYYMTKVTRDLAYMSIFFFFLQLINPSSVEFIGKLIALPPRLGNPGYSNFLLFTFDTANHPHRNCGFSWEPGAYGCLLDIGLLIYLLINGFKFSRDVVIYAIAIATTQSTTTYLGFLIIILLYARVNGLKTSAMLLVLVPSLIVAAVALPFMFDKIGTTWDNDMAIIYKLEGLSAWYLKNGGEVPLNRFGSLIYIWRQFHWALLWGISNGYQDATKLAGMLNLSNGDADYLAKFGLVGLIYYVHRFLLVMKKFLYKKEYLFYCALLILCLGFGEPVLTFTSSLCFLFLPKFVDPEKFFRKQEEEEANMLQEQEEIEEANLAPVN